MLWPTTWAAKTVERFQIIIGIIVPDRRRDSVEPLFPATEAEDFTTRNVIPKKHIIPLVKSIQNDLDTSFGDLRADQVATKTAKNWNDALLLLCEDKTSVDEFVGTLSQKYQNLINSNPEFNLIEAETFYKKLPFYKLVKEDKFFVLHQRILTSFYEDMIQGEVFSRKEFGLNKPLAETFGNQNIECYSKFFQLALEEQQEAYREMETGRALDKVLQSRTPLLEHGFQTTRFQRIYDKKYRPYLTDSPPLWELYDNPTALVEFQRGIRSQNAEIQRNVEILQEVVDALNVRTVHSRFLTYYGNSLWNELIQQETTENVTSEGRLLSASILAQLSPGNNGKIPGSLQLELIAETRAIMERYSKENAFIKEKKERFKEVEQDFIRGFRTNCLIPNEGI
jgi:hypothetical protein